MKHFLLSAGCLIALTTGALAQDAPPPPPPGQVAAGTWSASAPRAQRSVATTFATGSKRRRRSPAAPWRTGRGPSASTSAGARRSG